jgi:hypothetical protein
MLPCSVGLLILLTVELCEAYFDEIIFQPWIVQEVEEFVVCETLVSLRLDFADYGYLLDDVFFDGSGRIFIG